MKPAGNPVVGVTFICPHCNTWVNYHQPNGTPIKALVTTPEVLLIVGCEDCGENSTISLPDQLKQ